MKVNYTTEPNEIWEYCQPTYLGEHYVIENPKYDRSITLKFAPPIVIGEGVGNVYSIARSLVKSEAGSGMCRSCGVELGDAPKECVEIGVKEK